MDVNFFSRSFLLPFPEKRIHIWVKMHLCSAVQFLENYPLQYFFLNLSFLHELLWQVIQLSYISPFPLILKLAVVLAAGYSSTFDVMVQPWSYRRSSNGLKERIFPS